MTTDQLFRVYDPATDVFGQDGYPQAWHSVVKYAVRQEAGHRCIRCHHPYVGVGDAKRLGISPTVLDEGWSPCDEHCTHGGPIRDRGLPQASFMQEASWRILTVHHLTGDKADCRWWNLVALCQRCHLTIQGKVRMDRPWPHPHTKWFEPYAAGWYAWKYHGVELSRPEVEARLDDLLELERWPSLPLGDV